MTTVLTRCAGRVGHITLNRPEARNAITVELAHALERALEGGLALEIAAVVEHLQSPTALERFATRGGTP